MSSFPQLNNDLVNQQPDANSGGGTFTDDLETSALDGVDLLFAGVATRIAGNGRMPNDPANPNFGGLPRGSTATTAGSSFGLILLVLVILALV